MRRPAAKVLEQQVGRGHVRRDVETAHGVAAVAVLRGHFLVEKPYDFGGGRKLCLHRFSGVARADALDSDQVRKAKIAHKIRPAYLEKRAPFACRRQWAQKHVLVESASFESPFQSLHAKMVGQERDSYSERRQGAGQEQRAQRPVGFPARRPRMRNIETGNDADCRIGLQGQALAGALEVLRPGGDEIVTGICAQPALADVLLNDVPDSFKYILAHRATSLRR